MGQKQSAYAEVAQQQYPHYKTYTECQSRAFQMGMVTYVSGAAVIFVGLEAARRVIPVPMGARIIAPVLGGSVVAYIWTRKRTQFCQEMWMALEGKHSSISPISAATSNSKVDPGAPS